MEIIIVIPWVILTIFLEVMYHKLFCVIYTDLLKGIVEEIFACAFIAFIISALLWKFCISFWKPILIVLVVILILSSFIKKKKRQ